MNSLFETSEQTTLPPRRQCWECLRRRLVCDFAVPSCKKCQNGGKDCPGYDPQKPLQWLAPGKVTSRRRKKDLASSQGKAKSSSAEAQKAVEPKKGTSLQIRRKPGSAFELSTLAQAGLTDEMKDVDADAEEISRTECSSETSDNLQTLSQYSTTTISYIQEMIDMPRFELTNETYDVVQAVHYYNTKVYPELLTIMELAPNPYVIFFPLAALHFLPVSVLHTLACYALCHRIHQLPPETERLAIVEKWSRVYYHRGVAIREMSEKISQETTRCSDGTITSVCLFLCMELQQSTSPNWQYHADGLMKLIALRGGFVSLFESSIHIRPVLITFLLVAILGNTMSPPDGQINLTASLSQLPPFIAEIYDRIFPHVLCPPSLFQDIIGINHLRYRTKNFCIGVGSARAEAEELLTRIDDFSPEDWAQPNSFHSEWLLIGTIFQSSVAVYCISSLQSLSILPTTPYYDTIKASHGDRMLLSLKAALLSRRARKFMLWPLVVAGVVAMDKDIWGKDWVAEQLTKLSRDIGSSSPLKARAALESYWKKGKKGWDDCWDQPNAFVV